MEVESRRVVLANGLISSDGIIDEVERFKKIEGDRLYILEDEEFNSNVDEVRFSLPHSLMASILAQNSSFGKKAIGVHFWLHNFLTFFLLIIGNHFLLWYSFKSLLSQRGHLDNFPKS